MEECRIMYKVFLVEDEIVVREGIRNSIPWEKTSYILAGEAPDGEMALSMIQDIKPDILITDIRMPFMDGLALSRMVKHNQPWIKIIILSGHDEFEYARQAISAGVEEYLLKPVSSADMLKTLDKIAKRIDEEKIKLLDLENLKAQVRSSSDMLRDKWLSDVMNGRIAAPRALEMGRELGIDLLARFYRAAVIHIEGGKESEPLAVKLIIKSIMEKYPACIYFQEQENRFGLLIRGESAETVEETAYTIAQAVVHEIKMNTQCGAAVAIGISAERFGSTAQSYETALKTADYLISQGRFQIADHTLLPSGDIFNPAELPPIHGDLLLTRLKYGTKKELDSIIREYTRVLEHTGDDNPLLFYFVFGEILVAASKIVEALQGDIKEIAPFSLKQEYIHEIINSRQLFFEQIRGLLNAVIEWRDAHSDGRYQSVIMKAREYIDEHFASEDISLYSTASFVGISPNHLSTVFAQETGEHFIDYLTRVRIEKAKQLLKNTALKNADIASETGFSDPHYFSYLFKKNTGMSPREYRVSYTSNQ
jgi:two-component system response regulator YesN